MRGPLIVFSLLICTKEILSSPVTCSNYNTACDEVTDDLLDIMTGVETLEECRAVCLDQEDCNYFTYYDLNSSPLREACFTYRDCPSVHECHDCVSESKYCQTCGVERSGIIDENLLDFMTEVESEIDCKAQCISTPNCSYYTYFTAQDSHFPELCFLLSSLEDPVTVCPHCLTGPRDCQEEEPACQLEYEGKLSSSLLMTRSGVVNIVSSTGTQDCLLTALAVGGGGKGGEEQFLDYGGGGGSGYIEYFSGSLNKDTLDVTVGRSGEYSSVESRRGRKVLRAEAGVSGEGWGAGDGYSGGGGGCCNRPLHPGGTNGGDGDGERSDRGRGNGLDVSTLSFQHFSLTPGAGGANYTGGGGGGVLINNLGPEDWVVGQGEGWGGGGEGNTEGYKGQGHPGGPGVVIMEIRRKR